jgi:hypothetical protein
MRGDQLLDRTKSPAPEFAGHGVGIRRVRTYDSYQPDSFALLCQMVIDPGVIAPKGAHADHRDVDEVVGCQFRSQEVEDLITTDSCSFKLL